MTARRVFRPTVVPRLANLAARERDPLAAGRPFYGLALEASRPGRLRRAIGWGIVLAVTFALGYSLGSF